MHYFGLDNTVPPQEENTSETSRNTEKDGCFLLVQQMSTKMSILLQCRYAGIRFLKKLLEGSLPKYDKYLPSLTFLQSMTW